ncbi:MAG: aminotransferase class V-fold PLP-dependent enzyme [Firmicutes bacterium]|nr:aminotransferase class V-fold PLP-dependent enzyme [Bacillota bacterium]
MKTVEEVRRDLPVLDRYVFLNAGSLCPTPEPVMAAWFEAYRQWHLRGAGLPRHYEEMREQKIDVVREQLARLLNCSAAELAFTANATEGINIVAWGIDWQPGDEVIITDLEHPANSAVWLHNRERFGIRLRILPVQADKDAMLTQFRSMLSPWTRLVAVSHVISGSGQILPVAEICRLAKDAGALVLLDGAHAVGQLPVDLANLACDFYALNGHKWLLGPAGTGALFVRGDKLEQLRPSWVGDVAGKGMEYTEDGSFMPPPGARRYEFATRDWSAILGLGAAIDYVNDIGIENIRARVLNLVKYLRERLQEIEGAEVVGAATSEESAGLVAFSIRGVNAVEACEELAKQSICPRYLNEQLFRVSIGYFTLKQELDRLVTALKQLQ